MNKIYIGNTEVANVGGGGGGGQEFNPSDYVDASTWNEHEKVIASALVDLKGLEDQIEAFDADIQAQEDALLAEVHAVEQTKADVSVVYTKTDIDKSDKVVAAALASLNERVTTLETSSGGSGGSGDSFDPEYLEVELADVSARVDALEQVDYVVTNDISVFVKENDISTFITDNDISTFVTQTALDVSFNALDTSIIALDASVKELAESGGGGGGLADTDVPFIRIQNDDGSKWCYVPPRMSDANKTNVLKNVTGNGAIVKNYYNIANRSYKGIGIGLGNSTGGNYSFAAGYNTKADGQNSVAFGYCSDSDAGALAENSFVQGDTCTVNPKAKDGFAHGISCVCGKYGSGGEYAHAEGGYTKAISQFSHSEGYNTSTNGESSHAEGIRTVTFGNYSHAEGGYTRTYLIYEHAAGKYNSCSSTGGSTFGSPLNTLSTIGNGASDSSRHNAFEVRQSGDIYVADVSASGEYYEKPMINLQQKLYTLDASVSEIYSMIPIITYDPSTKILNIITE